MYSSEVSIFHGLKLCYQEISKANQIYLLLAPRELANTNASRPVYLISWSKMEKTFSASVRWQLWDVLVIFVSYLKQNASCIQSSALITRSNIMGELWDLFGDDFFLNYLLYYGTALYYSYHSGNKPPVLQVALAELIWCHIIWFHCAVVVKCVACYTNNENNPKHRE